MFKAMRRINSDMRPMLQKDSSNASDNDDSTYGERTVFLVCCEK